MCPIPAAWSGVGGPRGTRPRFATPRGAQGLTNQVNRQSATPPKVVAPTSTTYAKLLMPSSRHRRGWCRACKPWQHDVEVLLSLRGNRGSKAQRPICTTVEYESICFQTWSQEDESAPA